VLHSIGINMVKSNSLKKSVHVRSSHGKSSANSLSVTSPSFYSSPVNLFKRYWFVILLLIFISAISTLCYHIMIKSWDTYAGGNNSLEKEHYKYVNSDYDSTLKYRILVPYTIDFLNKNIGLPIKILYDLYHMLFLSLSLTIFFFLLKKWHPDIYAFFGTIFLCVLFQLGYNLVHPGDAFTLFTLVSGIYLMIHARGSNSGLSNMVLSKKELSKTILYDVLLAILIFIATFNKEITIFLVAFYFILKAFDFFKSKDNKEKKRHLFLFVMVALSLLLALVVSGRIDAYSKGLFNKDPYSKGSVGFYQLAIVDNLTQPALWVSCLFFYNIIPFLAFTRFRKRPIELRLLTYGMFLYFFATFFVGLIGEWRNQLPTMLVLIPLMLFTLREKFDSKHERLLT